MKKMLKLMLTASVSAAVMLASCTEGDLPSSPTPPATEDTPVQVELKLKSEQMDTRAIDEAAINDINIYFFGNNITYHFYYPEYAPSFVFEILPGTYTLCVVTNVHKDICLLYTSGSRRTRMAPLRSKWRWIFMKRAPATPGSGECSPTEVSG